MWEYLKISEGFFVKNKGYQEYYDHKYVIPKCLSSKNVLKFSITNILKIINLQSDKITDKLRTCAKVRLCSESYVSEKLLSMHLISYLCISDQKTPE